MSTNLHNFNTQNEIATLLQNWEKFCDEQSQMHSVSVSYFRFINYVIAIPAILLSTFSGAGSIGLASSCDTDSLSIALGFLVLISGAMFSIHRYMNIPELQQMHDFYGDEFYKLSNSIRLNLVLSTDESRSFKNIQEYAKFIKGQIDICVDKAPGIPRHVLRRTKQKLGGNLTIMSKCGDTDAAHSDITYNPPIQREIRRVPEIEILQQRSHAQVQSFAQLHFDNTNKEHSNTNQHTQHTHSQHNNMLFIHEDRVPPSTSEGRSIEMPKPRKESSSKACINPDTWPS
jgi:hypothetical protein